MQFIAHYMSTLAAIVYFAFLHWVTTYIVMERSKGNMVGRDWLPSTEGSKQCILEQLMDMNAELRSVP